MSSSAPGALQDQRNRIAQAVLVTLILGSVFQTATFYFSGAHQLALANLSSTPIFMFCLYLLRRGHVRLARGILVFAGILGSYFVASHGGFESQFHVVLLYAGAVAAYFFDPDDWIYVF